LNNTKLLDTDGGLDDITTSSERMLLTDECLDAFRSHPDGSLGSNFSELESVQNLPSTMK
jgi:hypothetical protein